MKHRLPTLGGKAHPKADPRYSERARSHTPDWAPRPAERPVLPHKVVAVAHVNQVAGSGKLAEQLCAAFRHETNSVGALVTIDSPATAADAKAIFAAMMEAGATQAKLLSRPAQDPQGALASAVEELAGAGWIIAWGNALPQLWKPHFTIVVTGPRRDVAHAEPLIIAAELEVTAPGPELATLLARRLAGEGVA